MDLRSSSNPCSASHRSRSMACTLDGKSFGSESSPRNRPLSYRSDKSTVALTGPITAKSISWNKLATIPYVFIPPFTRKPTITYSALTQVTRSLSVMRRRSSRSTRWTGMSTRSKCSLVTKAIRFKPESSSGINTATGRHGNSNGHCCSSYSSFASRPFDQPFFVLLNIAVGGFW